MHSSTPVPAPPVEATTAEEAVITTMMSLGRRMRQRLPGDEIDIAALHVLKTLHQHGPMRLSALAAALELDASTVSRHARQLEDRGLLARTGDPDDGRASRVASTEAGAECLEKCLDARRAMVTDLLGGWSAQDRERLRALLNRFHHDLTHHDLTHHDHTHHDQETA